MSETIAKMPPSRRAFLKSTAAAGTLAMAGVGLVGCGAAQSTGGGAEERVAYTYHHSHCGNMCALKCTVREGRLVCIEPNDAMCERRYQTLCLKGISEVQHIYSDHRIQTPTKRTGERGSGEFEAVSWEEALDDIALSFRTSKRPMARTPCW